MREIKFRGWYGGKFGMRSPEFNGNINEIFSEGAGVYMQYTGLKDKNGHEIYEGDILEITPENREYYPEKSVFFVVSTPTLWGYDFYWEHVSGYGCSTHITRIDDNYEQLLNVEVIGNIYENPELLEGELDD